MLSVSKDMEEPMDNFDHQLNLLAKMLAVSLDIHVFGLPGIGKSYLVKQVFTKTKTTHFNINCMDHPDKVSILKALTQHLSTHFDYKLPSSGNVSGLITHLRGLRTQLAAKKKFASLLNESVYIVFDNAQFMNGVSGKFLDSLLKIKQLTGFKIAFIFISNGEDFFTQIKDSCNFRSLAYIAKFRKERPTETELSKILFDYLDEVVQTEKNMVFYQKIIQNSVRDFVQSFTMSTIKISSYKHISKVLLSATLEHLETNSKSFVKNPSPFLASKNDLFVVAKKIFLDNPESKIGLNSIKNKIYNEGKVSFTNDAVVADRALKLAKIPSLILIACYFACKNPEKTDKWLFKDYKRKGRKSKASKEGVDTKDEDKPIKIQRLKALFQSLASVAFDSWDEFRLWDQSMDFYTQINLMEELQLLTKISKGDDSLSQTKFRVNISSELFEALCKKHSIKVEEFMYKPTQ